MKLLAALALAVSFAVSSLFSAATTTTDAWLGPDPHAAVTGLPGAPRWPAAAAAAAPSSPALEPAAATVEQVRQFFAGLTAAQAGTLAELAPGVVGNLDGAPYDVRYTANERARQAEDPHGPRPEGRLLAYDPRGDGRIIQVFGDLGAARHVAVLVPGSGWSLETVLERVGPAGADPVSNARALRGEIGRLDPDARVAVVVWLGYDAPEDVDRQAVRSERAIAGAAALTRFVAGLSSDAQVSLLCHSYGAVVCGRAAPTARVRDMAVMAAPGMDADAAADLGTTALVWAARTPDDPIRFVPDGRLGGFGHGTAPTGAEFGARVFAAGSARGHDGYYTPGTESLTNLARIVLGRDTEVTHA